MEFLLPIPVSIYLTSIVLYITECNPVIEIFEIIFSIFFFCSLFVSHFTFFQFRVGVRCFNVRCRIEIQITIFIFSGSYKQLVVNGLTNTLEGHLAEIQ